MNKQILEAGSPLNLKNSVEYSDGSIVSKTLINKDSLTLTLFAFDLGQGLSEHSAPFDALVEVVDGAVELKIGGEIVNAKTGDLVLMPANIPHSVKAVERFKMLLTMVRA